MTTRALVYGDIDLNLIDGSAIWLQSVTQALAAAGCEVTLVLKAPVRTSRLIAPLLTEPGVTVRRPFEEHLLEGPGPLRVVFYGLYTPLQGTPVIGAALSLITGAPIQVTMIGGGQDAAAARAAAAANAAVRWVDWVPAAQLPALVAAHDVCLGIFGTGEKALCVVPNKVFQGAAAGCAIITSDTAPQRRALGPAAVLVPPGDPRALADALLRLAADRAGLASLRGQAARRAAERFAAGQTVAPLLHRLRPAAGRPGAPPAADRAHPVSRPVSDAPAEDPLIR